jgi:hypothetical protein
MRINVSQLFLSIITWKKGKKLLFSVCLLLAGYLSGCGGGDDGIGERLSGPASDAALPIRIDATVTPTSTPTPESDLFPEEFPLVNEDQLSPTPSSEEAPILSTLTRSLTSPSEENAETETTEKELIPLPTPLSTPTPTSTVKAQATPQPSPVSSKEETEEKPAITPTTAVSEKKTRKPKQNEESEPEQKVDEQSETKKKTEDKNERDGSSEVVAKSSAIKLDQVVICSKITNRDPVNAASTFSLAEVGKVYTWIQVSGVTPPKTIKHIYYREGKVVARVTLRLRYASMRTWSEKTFKPEESLGKWKVVITTNNEKEILAVKEFTVTP